MVTREQIEAAREAVSAARTAYDEQDPFVPLNTLYDAWVSAGQAYDALLAQAAAHVEACEKALREAQAKSNTAWKHYRENRADWPRKEAHDAAEEAVLEAVDALIAAWAVVGKGEGDAK